MTKPRVAIFDFACCEGCQLQIINTEETILDLLNIVHLVEWREGISDHSDQYDIAIIEGSITCPEDEQRLKDIRRRAKILVALGACATTGGVNKLRNRTSSDELRSRVYGPGAATPQLSTYPAKPLHELVKVDVDVHGCPISSRELGYVIRCLAAGSTPVTPKYPVCVECKMRETICRYEYNEVCLGVITRAGCEAPCPAGGQWCFGCRGMVDDPNINAAHDIMAKYGKTADDLRHRMDLFNSTEATPCSRP